ncbi:MAG: PAS domain-containing protein [Chitinophagaceae bacterium]|nr:PAS domain-containing protein [Anaerolineae bacterium]
MKKDHQDWLSAEESIDFQTKLKALHEVSRLLSEADSVDTVCRLAVELGCDQLGFDRLGVWFFDEFDEDYIIGTFGTDENGLIRDERDQRIKVNFKEPFLELFRTKAVKALRHNADLQDHSGQVIGRGELGVTIFWDGERKLGWLSVDNFISRQHLTNTDLELLALYGATLGQIIVRKRAEAALRASEEAARHFQSKLKMLHEVTTELSQPRSFDEFCYQAVALGRSKLGFDRLGLWFFDSDPDYIVGSFGTDETGEMRDERGQRVSSKTGFKNMIEMLDGRVFASDQNGLLYNDRQEVIGTGWIASAVVWDGDRSMGWLSTDNFFRKHPLTQYELELLALYADTLGHLAAVRQVEETLTSERNMLRTIIDTVPDFIFVKDLMGRFMLVNRASWEATTNANTENDLIGKTDFDIHEKELAEYYWQDDLRVISTGQPIQNVEEPGHVANRTRYLLTTKVPLYDPNGKIMGLVGVARDITKLKETEKQSREIAIERERIQVLKEFIANISHDLRTPLSVINTSLYLLEKLTDPQKQQDKLGIIKQQAALLERLIVDILTMFRLENISQSSRNPVDCNNLLLNICENLQSSAHEKQIVMTLNMAENLPKLVGDQDDLNRMLTNLVQNAITYTDSGGQVMVTTYQYHPANSLVVEIADTGRGISPKDLTHIFDHFYRVDKARSVEKGSGSTGLGLSIARRIVELHGGKIEVESVLEQGSIFRVFLPYAENNF